MKTTTTTASQPRKERQKNNRRTIVTSSLSSSSSESSATGEGNTTKQFVSSLLSWPTRTTLCGSLDISSVGEKVSLCGWVDKQRDMGGICFADVRDHSGLVQIIGAAEGVCENQAKIDEILSSLRSECVVKVVGVVREP